MKTKKQKLNLFLFIDAFGWEVRQRHPDFLKGLVQDSKPLETILGYSSACDPSIISGRTPSEHKLWNSYFYDPEHSPFKWTTPLARLPAALFNHRRIRSLMGRWIKKRCGFTGYFQLYNVPLPYLSLYNYAEQKRIWEPGGLPQGKSIFDRLAENGVPYYAHDSKLPDEQRLENLRLHIENQTIEFAYCSLCRLDALMHEKGNDHPDIESLMNHYDAALRKLFTAADANYEDVAWYVFTDHGMHNITGTCDLISDIEQLGLRWNKDYIAVYDATMARFWFMNENARIRISHSLEKHQQGRTLSDQELTDYGVYFADRQYGELIFLMNSGIQIVPSFMGLKACKGMHGFSPGDPDSKAQIMSNRAIPESITKIQHIYQLMLSELKLD